MQRTAVLYITDTFIEPAGSERNLYEIVTRIDSRVYEPVVMCMTGGPLAQKLRARGFEVIDIALRRIYSPAGFVQALKLYRFIKRRNIRIVVTYHNGSDVFGGIVAWLARVPVIISSRRDMGYTLKKRHVLVYRAINRLFDRIVTVSEAVSAVIALRERVLWHKLVRIYNGADTARFGRKTDHEALRRALKLEPGRPVIGILAALRRIKGHEYFIQAAAQVAKAYPRAYFLVVGWIVEEEYFRELQALARKLGLEDNVRFIGGRSDTPEILSLFDIAVFSSISEGFSNAVIEAMAAAKPVVATRGGGTAEAITDGSTGMLVEPKDAAALAHAVLWLLEHRKAALEMGLRARQRTQETFSLETMLRCNEELYATLLESKEARLPIRGGSLARFSGRSIKQTAGAFLYYSGGMQLLRRAQKKSQGVKILAYHRVTDSPFVLPGMSIRIANFEQQIRYMVKHHTLLSLEQAVEMIDRREEIPGNPIVITFDDGYRDNYLHAFPILRKYRVPATIFLSVKAIDEEAALWFDVVLEAFRVTKRRSVDLRDFALERYELGTAAARIAVAEKVIEFAKNFSRGERDSFVDTVLERLAVPRIQAHSKATMMTWDNVKAMQRDGISFGNHGMSHVILTHLSKQELKYEIGKAKDVIRQRTGIDTKIFAYPNGNIHDFSRDVEAVLRRYEYTAACTLVKGSNDCTANRLTLRRLCVTEGMESNAFGCFSRSMFAVMLSGILGN